MKLIFTDKIHETNNIWSFRFKFEDGLTWQAGQSIRIELPRETWGYTERRFTITSLPSDKYLQITTRLSESEFKIGLGKLDPNNEVNAYNIEGIIDWGDLAKTKIFIAGGTGIDLFYMAIRQASLDKLPFKATLFYSSKDKPMLFHDFFLGQEKTNDLKLITSSKRFEVNTILEELQKQESFDIHIAGPNAMVFELKESLILAGLDSSKLQSNFLK